MHQDLSNHFSKIVEQLEDAPFEMTYTLTLIFSQPDLTIDVSIPNFHSVEEAEEFNEDMVGSLILIPNLEDSGKLKVMLQEGQEGFRSIEEDQMTYSIDIKRDLRPRPLDPSDPDDFKTILASLENPDSLYNIHSEDMEKIPGPIEDIWRGDIPYSFGEAIAYAINEEKQ